MPQCQSNLNSLINFIFALFLGDESYWFFLFWSVERDLYNAGNLTGFSNAVQKHCMPFLTPLMTFTGFKL